MATRPFVRFVVSMAVFVASVVVVNDGGKSEATPRRGDVVRLAFSNEKPPEWCQWSPGSPAETSEFQVAVQRLFVKALLAQPKVPNNNAMFKDLLREIETGTEPIFVVTAPPVSKNGRDWPERIKLVRSFDGLRGKRWEIRLSARGVFAKPTSQVAVLDLSWRDKRRESEDRQPVGPPVRRMDSEWPELGSQVYCALSVASGIAVSLAEYTIYD